MVNIGSATSVTRKLREFVEFLQQLDKKIRQKLACPNEYLSKYWIDLPHIFSIGKYVYAIINLT